MAAPAGVVVFVGVVAAHMGRRVCRPVSRG